MCLPRYDGETFWLVWFAHLNWNLFLISDWCAKYYEHGNFKGWEKVAGETSQLNLPSDENNKISSIRVQHGCIIELFNHHNSVELLDTLPSPHDKTDLKTYNDKVSSLSCTCQGAG